MTDKVFFHSNHIQTATLITDAQGHVAARIRHLPYGEVDVQATVDHRTAPKQYASFTGQELDEATGLIYYNARYYDPSLGRFISPDTLIDGDGTAAIHFNRYVYVRNNPTNFTDPTGRSATSGYLIERARFLAMVALAAELARLAEELAAAEAEAAAAEEAAEQRQQLIAEATQAADRYKREYRQRLEYLDSFASPSLVHQGTQGPRAPQGNAKAVLPEDVIEVGREIGGIISVIQTVTAYQDDSEDQSGAGYIIAAACGYYVPGCGTYAAAFPDNFAGGIDALLGGPDDWRTADPWGGANDGKDDAVAWINDRKDDGLNFLGL